MKRNVFIILFLMICSLAAAQKYEVTATVKIWYDNNKVKCNSHFKLVFYTAKGKYWEWYRGFNADEGEKKTYSNTFSTEPGDSIVRIVTVSHRYTESATDCDHRGGGSEELTDISQIYPCGSMARTGLFPGFDGQSTLTLTSKPLSNTFAIETDAYVVSDQSVLGLEFRVNLVYEDNSTENVLTQVYDKVSNGDKLLTKKLVVKASKPLLVKQIKVRTIYLSFGGGFPFDVVDETRTFSVTDTGGNFDSGQIQNNTFYNLRSDGWVRVRFGKPFTPITYGPGAGNLLPSENDITLTLPHGYGGFQWKYSKNNGSTWLNVPASLGTGKSITFSGQSLLGATYRNFLLQNILLKAVYTCAPPRASAVISLRHIPSSPGIVQVDTVMESCYGFIDAQLKIKFNRPLYTGETLYLFNNGLLKESGTNLMDADNVVTLPNLSPGVYNLTLQSLFNGDPGYSDGTNHRASKTILPRPAINFSIQSADVHCYDGQDGIIEVSATGGTKSFTSFLVLSTDTVQQIGLSSNATNRFNNLASGNYSVKLKDSNGCYPKDASNNESILPSVINQPLQGVVMSAVENVEPLGFGLTNGHITVRAENGTYPFTFNWTDENNAPLTSDPSQTEGTSMVNTLSNIGRGVYQVVARDNQFNLVTITSEVNLRGCYDTLTIVMDEPPLLEVVLDEYHFVSCYGYNNGELVAHAKGGRPYLDGETYHPYLYEWFVIQSGTPAGFGSSDSIMVDRPSALYRIKVTDRNGIIAWSPDYQLIQPNPLKLNFNTSLLLCNGDTNGTSEVLPQGGTVPYQYAWSTDESTPVIQNLSDGWYSVVVKDIRGCTTFGQTEVTAPNSLSADAEISEPGCYGYSDGSIQLAVAGGASPYQYNWDHGAQTALVQNLSTGNYRVKISDANNCFIINDYTVDQPDLVSINLGTDKVLCKDQTFTINSTIDDPAASYSWFKDNSAFASAAQVVLVEPGLYRLEIRDGNGCFNSDDMQITRDNTTIAADFAVATRLPKGERVRIANISHPSPERIEWVYPQEAIVLEEKAEYLELTFNTNGAYVVGIKSFTGACEASATKTVTVVDRSELTDYATPNEPYIKQFIVTPNPSDGNFAATVELREAGNFSLILYAAQGNIITRRDATNKMYIREEFQLASTLGSGVYLLQLVTSKGISVMRISVN